MRPLNHLSRISLSSAVSAADFFAQDEGQEGLRPQDAPFFIPSFIEAALDDYFEDF